MIVAVAPANAVTGGPEALHQLVYTANSLLPGSAAICYYPFGQKAEVPAPYRIYETPVVERGQIQRDDLVVLPEIWPDLAEGFDCRCALWWLSVDNFGTHGQRNLTGIDLHLFQSEYAAGHARDMGTPGAMLTDFLNPDFLDLFYDTELETKDRCVVVNPAKGWHLIQQFKALNPDIEVRELRGLDRAGVLGVLGSARVFIDFGHHPGRDRPPREAAMGRCVVFSTRLGAAANSRDVPIPNAFKFDEVESLGKLVRAMLESDHLWKSALAAQQGYREWVLNNERVFRDEVAALLDWAGLV